MSSEQVQVEARSLCAEHGIPDCSPLLNGCTVQHETPPETQALLDLTLTRLLNMSVRPTYPTSFVPIGGWRGVDAAAVSLLEGRGLAIVSRGEARLTKAGVEAATDLVTLTGGGAS